MSSVYENIKKRRKELNMTQTELAEAMGYYDKSVISKIERGLVDLPLDKFKEFAKVLNIAPIELLTDDFRPYELKNELLDNFDELNEEGKEVAVNMVKGLVMTGQYKKHGKVSMVEEEA